MKIEFWEQNSQLQTGDPLAILHQKEGGHKNRPQQKKKFFVIFFFHSFLT